MSSDRKRQAVIFTSAALLLKALALLLIRLFHLEHSVVGETLSGVTSVAALGLVFRAWSLVVRAGMTWKWRILILAFGPFAALMLPIDSEEPVATTHTNEQGNLTKNK